jgi:hypothetical protein
MRNFKPRFDRYFCTGFGFAGSEPLDAKHTFPFLFPVAMLLAIVSIPSGAAASTLDASRGSVTFGNIVVGTNTQQTVILTNSGRTTISISKISVTGSGFSESGLVAPLTLAAGRSVAFSAHFVPTVLGITNGSITIASNASDPLVKIVLSGVGVKQLSVNPSTISFGTVAVGNTRAQTITLTNYRSTTVSISRLIVGGTGFTESGLATPLTIAAGRSITLTAHFAPTVLGAANGSITIASNASDPLVTIALSGLGVRQLSASRSTISFGDVAVGSTSAQTVSLTNYGNTSVSISRVGVSGTGLSDSGLATPLTIAAGRSFTFTVHFAPTVLGAISGSIALTSNAFDPLFTITVSGTGTGLGHFSATPSSASFVKVVTGDTNSQPIRLNNTGSSSVTISSANVSGKGFRITGLTLPLTIASGRSATFDVVFAPTVTGSVAGSVSLVSNGTNSPFTIPLNGTGVAATFLLGANPSSLSFGTVNEGSSSSLNMILTNNGNSHVTISSVLVSGAGFSKSGAVAGLTLAPAQSARLSIAFAPAVAGNVTGSVTIASNATNSPAKISLSATGVLQGSHSVVLTWDASTSSDVVGYYVYRGTASGGPYTILTSSTVPVTRYTDSSVQAGHVYYYVVRSVDSSGAESSYSSQILADIPTP